MIRVWCSTQAGQLEAQLAQRILAQTETDRWRRQTVLVRNAFTRIALLRRLGELLPRAVLNLQVITLASLAQRLAALHGWRGNPLPLLPDLLLIRQLLARASGQAPQRWRQFDGVELTLREAFQDLSAAGIEPPLSEQIAADIPEALPQSPPDTRARFADLLQLYHLWLAHHEKMNTRPSNAMNRWLCERLESGTADLEAETGALHLYGWTDARPDQTALLRIIVARAPVDIYLPADPASADIETAPAREFLRVITGSSPTTSVALPAARRPQITGFTASGATGEAEEIARRIRELLDAIPPVPPHRIAVAVRDAGPYLLPLVWAFRKYAVPLRTEAELPGNIAPQIRAMTAIADCLLNGFRRDTVFDVLLTGPARLPPQIASMLHEFELLCRLMTITDGDDWIKLRQLTVFPRDIRLPVRAGEPGTDEEDDALAREEQEESTARIAREHVIIFADWIQKILQLHDDWPPLGPWPDHVCHLQQIIAAFGWDESQDDESRAGAMISNMLKSMNGWSGYQPSVTKQDFLRALRQHLVNLTLPAGGSAGVALAAVNQISGLSFDHVFLAGLSHGVFPRQPYENPFLTNSVKTQLWTLAGEAHPLREHWSQERLLFRLALESAIDTVSLSYPRSDEQGKPLSASVYVAQVQRMRAAHGEPLSVESVPRNTAERLQLAQRRAGLNSIPPADILLHLGLAHGSAGLKGAATGLPGVISARFDHRIAAPEFNYWLDVSRWLDDNYRCSAFDWLSGQTPEWPAAAQQLIGGPMWASRAEQLARCPFSCYLQHILGARSLGDAEFWDLDRAEQGLLAHHILERAFKDVHSAEALPRILDQLPRLAGEEFYKYAQQEIIGLDGLWTLRCDRLLAEVTAYVTRDIGRLLEQGVRPVAAERVWIGRLLLADGSWIEIAARADRIDAPRAGGPDTHTAVDYKTGGVRSNLADLIRSGSSMQIPFYLLLSERDYEGQIAWSLPPERSNAARAMLAFIRQPEDAWKTLPDEKWNSGGEYSYRWHALAVLQLLIRITRQGALPFRQGRQCSWCDVRSACRQLDFAARFRQENTSARDVRLLLKLLETREKALIEELPSIQEEFQEIIHEQ